MNARKFDAVQTRYVRNANRQAAQMILDAQRMAVSYFRHRNIETMQPLRGLTIECLAEAVYEPTVELAIRCSWTNLLVDYMCYERSVSVPAIFGGSGPIPRKGNIPGTLGKEMMKTIGPNISEIIDAALGKSDMSEEIKSIIIDRCFNYFKLL